VDVHLCTVYVMKCMYNCDMSARQAATTMEKHHTFCCYWQNKSAASRLHSPQCIYIYLPLQAKVVSSLTIRL